MTIERGAWRVLPVVLLGLLVLVPLMPVPEAGAWRGLRVFATQMVALGLLASLSIARTWPSPAALRVIGRMPNLALAALILWTVLSLALIEAGHARGRGLALVELLRLLCGAGICIAGQVWCRAGRDQRLLSRLILGGGAMVGVASLAGFSPSPKGGATAAFDDTQLLGAFLVGLFPFALVHAWSVPGRLERALAWLATGSIGGALLLTGTRSSWLGALIGVVVVSLIALRVSRDTLNMPALGVRVRLRQHRASLAAATAVAVVTCLCVGHAGSGPRVLHRLGTLRTLSSDPSVTIRLDTWRISLDLFRERPLAGWGAGAYPFVFGDRAAQRGHDQTLYHVPSASEVDRLGVGLSSMAHNEYLQMAVELGAVGLFLYLTMLGAFFSAAVRALRRGGDRADAMLLLAVVGAVAAQCTDAIANPAWRFRDVSPMLWLLLGLGLAVHSRLTPAVASAHVVRVTFNVTRRRRSIWPPALALLTAALVLASVVTRVGWTTAVAAVDLPPVRLEATATDLFQFRIVAKTGDGAEDLTEIQEYTSINDHGEVVFVAARTMTNTITKQPEARPDVYLATDASSQNITKAVNYSLASRYAYGPIQINNDGAIAVINQESETIPKGNLAQNAVHLWSQAPNGGIHLPTLIADAPIAERRFLQVTLNNARDEQPSTRGRLAYTWYVPKDQRTYLKTDATRDGKFEERLLDPTGSSLFYPMLADDDRLVYRSGPQEKPPESIRLHDVAKGFWDFDRGPDKLELRDYALLKHFSIRGVKPGISDDGLIVVFAGDLTEAGAEALKSLMLPLTPGPGIFAIVATRRGSRSTDVQGWTHNEGRVIVRIAGASFNGRFDPGELPVDANGQPTTDLQNARDGGVLKEFLVNERVAVNNAGTVVYLAKDTQDRLALVTSRLHAYAATVSVDPPVILARHGDTLDGLPGTIRTFRLADAINNRGEGDVAFVVETTNPTGTTLRGRSPQAVVRARPLACDRPTIVPSLPDTGLQIAAHDWRMHINVSESDGVVVEHVWYGERYMMRKLSVPYLEVTTRRDGVAQFADAHVELLREQPGVAPGAGKTRGRLIDFQIRTEADKLVIAGTYAVHVGGRPAEGATVPPDNCLLVTQRYEFRRYQPGDKGAPGLRESAMARFLPVVEYLFIGEQSRRRPHRPTECEVQVVQRLHFRPDAGPNVRKWPHAVTIFKDTYVSLVSEWWLVDVGTVPHLGDPLPLEQVITGVRDGARGDWDNWHETLEDDVDEPLPLYQGCPECVHIHWRWAEEASFPGFAGNPTFGFGEPLIPAGSPQTVEVGASKFMPGEEDPGNFHSLFLPEEDLTHPKTGLFEEPVMWYASTSRRDHDAFFTHGGHVTVIAFDTEGRTQLDADGDALPSEWERRFGLDDQIRYGDDGRHGDPDEDGHRNSEEYEAGTHPRGFFTRYFAEGATGTFFDTRFALLNVGPSPAHVLLRFQMDDGRSLSHWLTVGSMTRATVAAHEVPGLEAAAFATVIESDQPIAADRTMTWDATVYGSHGDSGVLAPATRWYFAEGATHGDFDLFYLLQNPGTVAAEIEIDYLRPAPADPVVRSYTIGPGTRLTIHVDDIPELADTDVSAVVRTVNDVRVIAERAMYFSRPGQMLTGGHESAGIPDAATQWYFAEGATGPFFDMFLLIGNPDDRAAEVTLRYLLPGGETVTAQRTVPARSRVTINVAEEDPRLRTATMSTSLTSSNGVPLIVERSMFWPHGAAGGWYEAHNGTGVTATGMRWALAGGESGGPRETQTFVVIGHPSAIGGSARVTLLFEDGATSERTVALAPNSRTTIDVQADFPAAVGRRYGALVESLGDPASAIVVEAATYSNAGGVTWAAGTCLLATRLDH